MFIVSHCGFNRNKGGWAFEQSRVEDVKAAQRRKIRDGVRAIHRYLAFVLGGLWLIAGATGSLITYHDEIDALFNPGLFRSSLGNFDSAQGAQIDFERANDIALDDLGPGFSTYRIILPRQPQWNLRVQADTSGGDDREVFIDPVTYAVLGTRETDDHWIYWIYDLHRELLAGNVGAFIVGVSGLFLILTAFLGLYLWWPRKGAWKHAFQVQLRRPWRRANWQFHRASGVIALPFLLIAAPTGTSMIFPEEFDAALAVAVPLEPQPEIEEVERPTCVEENAPSMARAVTESIDRYPGALVRDVWPIYPGDGYLMVHVAQPNDPRRISGGQTRLYFDETCGTLYHVRDPLAGKAGNTVNAWIFPLHNGEAFGEPGRAVIALLAAILVILVVGGLLHYFAKKKPKRRVTSRG